LLSATMPITTAAVDSGRITLPRHATITTDADLF
jgi:hypothetical protein